LLGNPGSGKSSIGDALIDLAGGERLSFAAGVKEEAARVILATDPDMLPFDRDGNRVIEPKHIAHLVARMNDPDTKDEYRRLLQVWGTDFRRGGNPQYWVEQWANRFNEIREEQNIVVDDCRFPNEESALRSNGFYFVRLEDGNTTRDMEEGTALHESESYWPEFVTDLDLSYVRGPVAQARRILSALLSI
jgi:hypothetical protein